MNGFPKYEFEKTVILKDGKAMIFSEIVNDLNMGSMARESWTILARKVRHGCADHPCDICDNTKFADRKG